MTTETGTHAFTVIPANTLRKSNVIILYFLLKLKVRNLNYVGKSDVAIVLTHLTYFLLRKHRNINVN